MAASRSFTAMATWPLSVSSMVTAFPRCLPSSLAGRGPRARSRTVRCPPAGLSALPVGVALEQGDAVLADPLPLGRVGDAQAGLGRQAQHAQLALGLVA